MSIQWVILFKVYAKTSMIQVENSVQVCKDRVSAYGLQNNG